MAFHRLAKNLFVVGLVCVVVPVLFGTVLQGVLGGSKAQLLQQSNDQTAIRDALRRDGLRGAAKLKGHYVEDFDPHWDFGQFDTETLTKNSAVVLVGVASRKIGAHLTESGLTILTDYEVAVQESFKGNVSSYTTVVVSLPGGTVDFGDGTSAELRTPTFEHFKIGVTYTLFLSDVDKSPGKYTLTGGPQGLVELSNNGTVKAHSRDTDPIAKETKEASVQSFLKSVREFAKKWPGKGKCCS